MKFIEVAFFQEDEKGYKFSYAKKETTQIIITEKLIFDWMIANLCWVIVSKLQGYKVDLNKHINIEVLIADINNGKTQHPTYKHFLCRKTTVESKKTLQVHSDFYLIENQAQFSKAGYSSPEYIINTIQYRTEPRYIRNGPEKPNPFRN